MNDDDLDLEPMNRGRNTPIIVGALLVLVAGAGAWLANNSFRGSRRTDSLERAGTAWNELRRCLIGEYLDASPRPTRLARRIEIGLPVMPHDVAPADRPTQWPFRCAAHASVLTHALFDAGSDEQNHRVLAMLASRAATALDRGELRTGAHDPQPYLDELFAAAELARLPPGTPARGPAPPAPAQPLAPRDLTALFASDDAATIIASDTALGRGMHWVLGQTARTLCVFAPGRDDASLLARTRCRTLTFAAAPAVVELLPGDDGARTVLRVGGTLYDGDEGHALEQTPAQSRAGFAYADGHVTDLVAPEGITATWALRRIVVGAPIASTPWRWPAERIDVLAGPWILGDQIVFAAADTAAPGSSAPAHADAGVDASVDAASTAHADAGHGATAPAMPGRPARMMVATLASDGTASPPVSIGSLPALGAASPLRACRVEGGWAVALHGANGRVGVAFALGGHWSAPVAGDAPSESSFNCRAHEASFTWIENTPHRWVRQLRCTRERCTETHGSFPTFEGEAQPVVTDLDGRVLLLVSPGPGRGLYEILAPVAELTRTDRRVVIDDAEHGGIALRPAFQLFARDHAAVALVSTAGDPLVSYAIRFDTASGFREVRHPGSLAP